MEQDLIKSDFKLFKTASSSLDLAYGGDILAGFPAPAEDFGSESIDLNKLLIKHPDASFYARVKGQSMAEDFQEGDLLIIDRSLPWSDNKIALCYLNNEFTLKRIQARDGKFFLMPSNKDFSPIEIGSDDELLVWGIVTHSIRNH